MDIAKETMMGLSETIVKILRHDAFIMELANYARPWFAYEPFRIIYDAYQSRIFKLFHQECFSAMAIELPQSKEQDNGKRALVCSFFAKNPNYVQTTQLKKEVIIHDSWIDWLWEQTSKVIKSPASQYSDEYSVALAALLNVGVNYKIFLIPYIVQECNESWFVELKQDPHKEYGNLNPELRQRFLYTNPIELYPYCGNLPTFPDAYFKSAWVIGVEDNGDNLEHEVKYFLEAISIMFQLSWGYPQLLKDKEEMARKAVGFKELEDIRQSAYDLTARFIRIADNAHELMLKLEPRPLEKVELLYRVDIFIPPSPAEYFKKWMFQHEWDISLIQAMPESFKAQFSCILLSHLGRANWGVGGDQPWPPRELDPWSLLKDRVNELSYFEEIQTTIQKVTSDDEQSWDNQDIFSYKLLKGIFHSTKKYKRVSGPLILFWAREKRAEISEKAIRCFYTPDNIKNIKTYNWPSIDLFVGLDGIYYLYNKDFPSTCKVRINAEKRSGATAITIKLEGLTVEYVTAIESVLGGLVPEKGDLATYISYITRIERTKLYCNYNDEEAFVIVEFLIGR